jgi:hypothetical protein
MGEWLLDEHVFSGFERTAGKLEVRRDRRRDDDRIEGWVGKERARVRSDGRTRVTAFREREALRSQITDGANPGVLALGEVSNEVRSPVPVSDHSHVQHCVDLVGFTIGM